MSFFGRGSSCGYPSDQTVNADAEAKVHVTDRLKRYVTQKRQYNYFGPFTAEEVSVTRVRRDEDGVGLYDIHVQCLGNISWTITLRYAQLYESYKWQVKYDKDLKLPLTFQFPPKKFCKTIDDEELEVRREGIEKWINGRIALIHNYESECEIMKNVEKEMSYLLKIGEHGPSLHHYNRSKTASTIDVEMRDSSLYTLPLDADDRHGDRISTVSGDDEKPEDSIIVVRDSEVEKANKQFDESIYLDSISSSGSSKSKSHSESVTSAMKKESTRCKGKEKKIVIPRTVTPPISQEAAPASSYMFTQCRSIWVPKNSLYVAVCALVCAMWILNVHVVYTALFVSCGLELSRRLEDHLLFAHHADIQADREYSLTGMVRLVFIGLIVLCYFVLHVVHQFVLARSPA